MTDIGLHIDSARDMSLPPALLTVSVINGTFSTKDEVLPVINITTPVTVSPTFNIAGTIYDVGGMGTAQATLKNTTHAAVTYDLTLNGLAPTYTFSEQVTWPIEDGVTLTVTATDDAGNTNTSSQVINVVDVGFSNPEPTGYINATPAQAQAFMSQIDKTEPITMYLGSATDGPTLLPLDTTTDYAKGNLPNDLVDGEYWVNVSGTDNFGTGRYLNWTFTLDTTAPVINTFTITDSDGDGYIEAGENLHLAWNVAADPNFDHVALVDTVTGQEVWSSSSISGTATTLILDGNRDLAFRAYDYARNSDSRGFHLYYDYMIWMNSTKMGEIAGIDTTYTAMKDFSRTAVSSITLYGCTVTLPTLNTLERTVTNVGQVTPDTYVTVDVNANRTLSGSETYRNVWVLDPGVALDFSVGVPHAHKAVLVLAEANESYIADLISGGSGGMHSVNYTELIKRTAYIFIEGGWTKVTVADDGTLSMDAQSGTPITNAGNISATLRHPANQVDLHTGYRLSTQGLTAITPASGDYVLAAIAMDGDRMGLLGAMPVMYLESGDLGSISNTTVVQGGTFTAQFTTPCEHLGVILLRDVTYNGTALIDAAKLDKESLHLNLTYNGIPATQKLIGNVYVSPSSGKYVVANTSQATVSTSGLDAGTYRVYMVGQSANGTMQAYGQHTLQITPGGSITVTSVPAGAAISLDGADTGMVTNGTLNCVPAGNHNVTVTLAGYAPASSQVTVVAGQTAAVHFALTPVGSISVTSVPTGAAIYLDGTSTGVVTDGTLNNVPVGNHTVMVTRSGYNSASSQVTVVANQTVAVHFTLSPTGGGGGGGGGSSGSSTSTYTSTGTLLTGSSGTVLKSVIVSADDNVGSLFVPIGTKALDANGNPLTTISIDPITGSVVPAVPTGAVFKFAGYAYEAGPAGATFEPGITLTLTPPDDFWNSLDLTNNQLTLMWYNQESGLWEEVQATISPGSKTVTATVTHFSTYALFTEPGTTPVTPTETATTVPTTTTTTPTGEPPAEGLPMTTIVFAIVIIAIIAAAGYYFFVMKK
ncbi:PEGA domain-containing protein [Methanoculleus formosensis]|uniref:PEGA domain-containing protein n=1 Tax=Methanoculleus formosensis TaxID=2590886 RepID=UPI0021BEC7D2|nr:PEGA domain-containing protein [Methanoculleus sp. Afa-1]